MPIRDDNFVLYADYPDPFLPETDTSNADNLSVRKGPVNAGTAIPGVNTVLNSNPEIITEKTVQGFLQYTGMISNPQKKLRIAIISIHGKEVLVKEKERIEDIRIKKIYEDRIYVLYKGNYYTVYKNR
jgi:type II secretory pathway component PulC